MGVGFSQPRGPNVSVTGSLQRQILHEQLGVDASGRALSSDEVERSASQREQYVQYRDAGVSDENAAAVLRMKEQLLDDEKALAELRALVRELQGDRQLLRDSLAAQELAAGGTVEREFQRGLAAGAVQAETLLKAQRASLRRQFEQEQEADVKKHAGAIEAQPQLPAEPVAVCVDERKRVLECVKGADLLPCVDLANIYKACTQRALDAKHGVRRV